MIGGLRRRYRSDLRRSRKIGDGKRQDKSQLPMPTQLNKCSSRITQPKSQSASQAMLYTTGLHEEDRAKPQVGIAGVWFEGNPCNMHLLGLAEKVKEGIAAAWPRGWARTSR